MAFTINGSHDHSDEEVVLVLQSGQRFKLQTLSSIDYTNDGEAGEVGGNQAGPVALTRGKMSPNWSGECSKPEFQRLIKAMGNGWLGQPFTILVHYRPIEGGGGLPAMDDTILGARLTKDGMKSQTGDPAMASIGGKCLKVLYDGVDPEPVVAG